MGGKLWGAKLGAQTLAAERLLGLLAGQEGSALTCAKVEGQFPEGRTEVSSQRARWDEYCEGTAGQSADPGELWGWGDFWDEAG